MWAIFRKELAQVSMTPEWLRATTLKEEKSWIPKSAETSDVRSQMEENIGQASGWYEVGVCWSSDLFLMGDWEYDPDWTEVWREENRNSAPPLLKNGNLLHSMICQYNRHPTFSGIIGKQQQSSVAFHFCPEASLWCGSSEPGHLCQDINPKKPCQLQFPQSPWNHALGDVGQLRVRGGQVSAVGNRGSQNFLKAEWGRSCCFFTSC